MAEYLIQSENLTAIADEIRVLSGTENTLSPDAMETKLQEANTDVNTESELISQIMTVLNGKADSVQLPTLTNAGVADDLALGKQLIDGSGNIVTGTHECAPSGVTVQVKSGTVTGVSGTAKTVSVGFKPDAVFFTGTNPQASNAKIHAGVAFTAASVTSMDTLFAPPSTSYIFSALTVAQTSSGFTVKGVRVNTSFTQSNESNRSLNWIAIKYTA